MENVILEHPNLTDECKINIIIKISENEYNMVRGRRDIIHFDNIVTDIMNIVSSMKQQIK